MRILLCTVLVLASAVNAETLECPKLFPLKELTLSADSSAERGQARVSPAHLSYAYIFFGELFGEQTLVGPKAKKAQGGWDTDYVISPHDSNWLVCRYGGSSWGDGDIEQWQKLDQKITSCVLKVREVNYLHHPPAWSASAVCK